jgi:hypothetical protein
MRYKRESSDSTQEITRDEFQSKIAGYYNNSDQLMREIEDGSLPEIRTPYARYYIEQ